MAVGSTICSAVHGRGTLASDPFWFHEGHSNAHAKRCCSVGAASPPWALSLLGKALCREQGEERRCWLSPRQQQGGDEALHTAARLSSYKKTQPPNVESGSASKHCPELQNSPQNETSPSPLLLSFLYKNKPARRLHLHTKGFVFRRKVSFLEQ